MYSKLSKSLEFFDRMAKNNIELEYMPKNRGNEIILCGYNRIGYSIVKTLMRTKKSLIVIDFNPEIVKFSWTKEWGEEGCLSVPGVFGQVKRSKTIICNYTDKEGAPQSIEVSGLMARVFQHEIDHLDGILFIDKAKKIK